MHERVGWIGAIEPMSNASDLIAAPKTALDLWKNGSIGVRMPAKRDWHSIF